MIIMAVKTKFSGPTKTRSMKVLDLGGENREYWVDLGNYFQELADRYTQEELDAISKKHLKGNAIIEAI